MLRIPGTITLAIAALILSGPGSLSADEDDRIAVRMPGAAGLVVQSGIIVDYTSESLYLQIGSDRSVKMFRASDVLEYATPRTSEHLRALEALKNADFDTAVSQLQSALKTERRAWMRREILARLVQSHMARGDSLTAGETFLTLLRAKSETRFFHVIPLAWAPSPVPTALKDQARQWLADESEAAQLMGASLLINDPLQSDIARATLTELYTSTDPRIHKLAQAQRWRVSLLEQPPSDTLIADWKRHIDSMPDRLRGGPRYVLGRGLWERREYDRAAAALLWVPLVYDWDRQLAARATLEAADALVECGQKAEAASLYREVLSRYAETTFAQDAKAALAMQLLRRTEQPDR